MTEIPGLHPETGLYHAEHMPLPEDPQLRVIREKQFAGEPLTVAETLQAGRDNTTTTIEEQVGGQIETFETKPDHVYRAIGYDVLKIYEESGAVVGQGEGNEYEPGNNKGVDWYLGGVALKYGEVVIEAPADPEYFQPADQHGAVLAKDPRIRHMKSSGNINPVPWHKVKVAHG